MAIARIYCPAKTAMQSGKAKSRDWHLEFEPASARTIDPLMGWTSSTDMNGQVRLTFESQEEAIAYAERHGIAFRLHEPNTAPLIIKAYADNFSPARKQPWTH
jgi:ETC complex I subunit conserved region.